VIYSRESITRGIFRAEIISNGSAQTIYTGHDGYRWVAGVPGSTYQVRVKSLGGRIGVALAVNGRDVLEDKIADLSSPNLQIIMSEYTFRGFRVDDSTTREFVFGEVYGSVAEQARHIGSVGTIGIAAWREMPHRVEEVAYRGMDFQSRGIAAGARAGHPSLDTHAGDTRHDPVHRVEFDCSGSPDILEIGYDTLAALDRMGITRRFTNDHPRAFPGSTTGYETYRP